jgi:hypothetical protein
MFSYDTVPHQHTNINSDPTPTHDVYMSTNQFIQFIQQNLPTPLNQCDETSMRNLLNSHCQEVKIMLTEHSMPPDLGQAMVPVAVPASMPVSAPIPASIPEPTPRSAPTLFSISTNHNNNASDLSQSMVRISGRNVDVRSVSNSMTIMSNHPIQRISTVQSNTHSSQRISTFTPGPHDQSRWPVHLRRSKYDTAHSHPTYGNSGVTKPAHKSAYSRQRVGNRRSNYGPPQQLDQIIHFPQTYLEYLRTYPYDAKSQPQYQPQYQPRPRFQPRIEFDDGSNTVLKVNSKMSTPNSTGRSGGMRHGPSRKSDVQKLTRSKERLDRERSAKDRRKEAKDRRKEAGDRYKEGMDRYKERRQYKKQFRRNPDREPFSLDSDLEDNIPAAPCAPPAPPINPRHGMNDTRLLMALKENGQHKLRFGTGDTDVEEDNETVADGSSAGNAPSRAASSPSTWAPVQSPDVSVGYAFQWPAAANMATHMPSHSPVFAPARTSAEAMANAMRALECEAEKSQHIKTQQVTYSSVRQTTSPDNDPIIKVETDTDTDEPVIKVDSETEIDDPVVKVESETEPSPSSTPANIVVTDGVRSSSPSTMDSGTITSGTVFSPSPRPKKRARDDSDDIKIQRGGVKRPIKKARLSRAM